MSGHTDPMRSGKLHGAWPGLTRGLVELYSETLLEHGYPPLPEHAEPLVSPRSRPDLARRYPLILTCAKNTLFCETQQRNIASLRRKALDPEIELHPRAAAQRGIRSGDWVVVKSPDGALRARAKLSDTLDPRVVCGEHGWWQACAEIGAQTYDAFSGDGSNDNLLIGNAAIDPTSGSVPHRALHLPGQSRRSELSTPCVRKSRNLLAIEDVAGGLDSRASMRH